MQRIGFVVRAELRHVEECSARNADDVAVEAARAVHAAGIDAQARAAVDEAVIGQRGVDRATGRRKVETCRRNDAASRAHDKTRCALHEKMRRGCAIAALRLPRAGDHRRIGRDVFQQHRLARRAAAHRDRAAGADVEALEVDLDERARRSRDVAELDDGVVVEARDRRRIERAANDREGAQVVARHRRDAWHRRAYTFVVENGDRLRCCAEGCADRIGEHDAERFAAFALRVVDDRNRDRARRGVVGVPTSVPVVAVKSAPPPPTLRVSSR